MADKMEEVGGESELVQIVDHFERGSGGVKFVKAQVMSIDKYDRDATNLKLFGNEDNLYFYDVILTDGVASVKAVVHPRLNHLMENNEVKMTSVCLVGIVEKVVGKRPCLVITNVKICQETSNLIDKDSLKFCLVSAANDAELSVENKLLPLTGIRVYFLNMWNDNIVEWPLPDDEKSPFVRYPFKKNIENLLQRAKNTSLIEMEINRRSLYLPILVRVMSITKLRNNDWKIGSASSFEACPFSSMLYVTDGTAVALVSIWTSVIARLHNKIEIGSMLLINKYSISKVKEGFNTNSRFANLKLGDKAMKVVSYEIKINQRDDAQIEKTGHPLYVFDNRANDHLPNYPFLNLKFFKSFDTYKASDKVDYIDVAGVVVSLSRYSRLMQKNGVFVCRIIEIVYWPAKPPVRIVFFVNSQLGVHQQLSLGDKVVVCNLRIPEIECWDSLKDHEKILTTSQSSRVIILTADNRHLFKEFREVVNLYDISSDLVEEYLNCGRGVGGLDLGYSVSCRDHTLINVEEIQPNKWNSVIEKLRFWAHQRILITGKIVHVNFVRLQPEFETSVIFENNEFLPESYEILGMCNLHQNTFPHRYNKNSCQKPLQFPQTSLMSSSLVGENKQHFLNVISDGVILTGYYEIIIANDDGPVALRCILIPIPAKQPFPSFLNLINGEYSPNIQGNPREPQPTYSNEELNDCKETIEEIKSIPKSKFLIDLFKHSVYECEIVLVKRYDSG